MKFWLCAILAFVGAVGLGIPLAAFPQVDRSDSFLVGAALYYALLVIFWCLLDE